MKARAALFGVIALCVVIALCLRWTHPRRPAGTPAPPPDETNNPPQPEPAPPDTNFQAAKVGQVRLANDAALKSGDFWVEQAFELADSPDAGSAIADLYLALDAKDMTGTRVRLTASEVLVECAASPAKIEWKQIAKAECPALGAGRYVLGALWRRGQLSVWLDNRELLTCSPPKECDFKKASAIAALAADVRFAALQTVSLSGIRFDDSFMRATADGNWKPLAGRWELTSLAFPERSANPFSLRVSFRNDAPGDDKLYQGRLRHDAYGLGIEISPFEGTLCIIRITGGSPAARAGLAEQDIFLEIDGANVQNVHPAQAYQMIARGANETVSLRMLRPGEKKPREFLINRSQFKWGTPSEGIALQPQLPPVNVGSDQAALIATGRTGWSDYAAEVALKPLGSGGAGLVFGMTAPDDYFVFRWRGPMGRGDALAGKQFDRLQLVRVRGGVEGILVEKPGGYRPYEFYRMAVDWSGEKVACLIDGNEILSANIPDLKRGQIGLYALRGDPVFFDDVRVASDRGVLVAAHHPEAAVNQIMAGEENMEVWANPALEWDRDLKTGWAVHKSRFPGEIKLVLNKPRFGDLEVRLHCDNKGSESTAPILHIKDGEAKISSAWHSLKACAGRVPDGAAERIIFREFAANDKNDDVEAQIGSLNLRTGPDGTPPHFIPPPDVRYDSIAIRGLKNLGDPNTVRITSSNALEYTFNDAPADWKVACGRWGLLNKWICDPRWSWFGGRSKTLGAIWNKYVFSGDISVDGYIALMMQKDEQPYERPGDYNLAICGDGVNLDSGYTLVFGGDNNSWTRLYRKGKLVAESNQEEHRVYSDRIRHPDKPELHQRWFHLKLEKIGNAVSFYRDDNLAFTFDDPDPLPEGRVGFWTLDNGFLLARVRIAHSGARPAPFEPRQTALFEDPRLVNTYDAEVWTNVEPQRLPPAISASLAAAPLRFAPADADPLPGDQARAQDQAEAYRVVNGIGGGPFSLQWRRLTIDPESRSVVRFAYRIEPGAKVDLYLVDVSDAQHTADFNPRQSAIYRWRLTGPRESDEIAPLVGEVPGVKDDGRWHSVQFDLNPSWQAFWQRRGQPRQANVMKVMTGNLSNQGYLLAGFNGNHAGAAYSISDIAVMRPQEADPLPPKVERVVWPYDADGDGQSLVIVLSDPGGSGVLRHSLDVVLNDFAVPKELLEFDAVAQPPSAGAGTGEGARATSASGVVQHLRIPLLKLNLPAFKDGQVFTLKVLGFEDRAEHPSGASFTTSWTYSAAKVGPASVPAATGRDAGPTVNPPEILPQVEGAADRLCSTGALSVAEASPAGHGRAARLEDSSDAPPWALSGQRRSIHVVSPADGSSFGFQLNTAPCELRRFPYLQFDYKIPFEMPVNLYFNDSTGSLHELVLNDTGNASDMEGQGLASHLGPPSDFVSDGTWRRCTVPLQQLLERSGTSSHFVEVQNFGVFDYGWRGNRRGMEYWIHRIQPLAAGRSQALSFTWQAADLAGIVDFASCLDDKPDTVPSDQREISSGELLLNSLNRRAATLKDGWNYLHVRVKNAAGVWSQPAHCKFLLDNEPPKVVRTEPAAGGTHTSQCLRVFVEDASCVDLRQMILLVNDRVISGQSQGVSYDPQARAIVYNALVAGSPWPDGTEVKVELRNLADSVGNRLLAPHAFSFTIDRSKDRVGPAVERMRFVSATQNRGEHRQIGMETSFGLDFEQHTGHVHAIRDCRMDWLNDPAQAAFGKRAVKFTCYDDDADVQIMLHKNAWYMDRLPLLQFDYKAEPGFCVDLIVEVLGDWHTIKFLGSGRAPEGGKAIGAIQDVAADGTWRHASVDLVALLNAALPNLEIRIINKIFLSVQGQDGCKRGATLALDNLDLSAPQGEGGWFEWEASDPSGIAGYSFVFDQDPATTGPTQFNVGRNSVPVGGQTGVWYAHARACDQSRNWGPTRHFRVDFGTSRRRGRTHIETPLWPE